jgi:hypothetical protein
MPRASRAIVLLVGAGLALLLTVSDAPGNAGVFMGNGQNLRQFTSRTIQLVSEDVTIVLGPGLFPFDGGLPGMERAEI